LVTVHNFSDGLYTPILSYSVSCLGAFLGLRCVIRASYYTGGARARWLAFAAIAIGATCIWAMHFIAMLGFSIPGQVITYNLPITFASMLIVIAVVYLGLVIVGYRKPNWVRLLVGGLVIGLGVSIMHYLGMDGMNIPYQMSYKPPLFAASIAIAIVAGTAALWIGTWVRSIPATIGAAMVMGIAVSAMHYTGMAAMQVHNVPMQMSTSGVTGSAVLMPLLIGISLASFLLALMITLAPSEADIRADAEFESRLSQLQQRS
jgi:NO-binding membrane sensor protein with MHYT domain